jgi:hypothetical protein
MNKEYYVVRFPYGEVGGFFRYYSNADASIEPGGEYEGGTVTTIKFWEDEEENF